MIRTLILILIAVVIATVNIESKPAKAVGPSLYSWEYNQTNLYTDTVLVYSFSVLDATATYQWRVDKLNFDGSPGEFLFSLEHTGATTFVMTFGAGAGGTFWDEDEYGPFQVTDNFGNLLGTHFIAPRPTDDWRSASGNSASLDKQSPAAFDRVTEGDICASPPYQDVNVDGWHFSHFDCSVFTRDEGFFLFHYRQDDTALPTGDAYIFENISTADTFLIDADELYLYQSTVGWLPRESTLAAQNFVVVNVSGLELPFVSYLQADAEFSIPTNPPRFLMIPSVYSCIKETSVAVWISDCESPLIVSESGTGFEWTAEPAFPDIGITALQTVVRRQHTQGIWDTYNGAWQLEDGVTVVDSVVYSFANSRTTTYASPAVVAETRVLSWVVFPNSVGNLISMTITEARFFTLDGYRVSDVETAVDKFVTLIETAGLNTDFGKVLIFIGLVLMFMIVAFKLKLAKWAFVLLYLIIGGTFIIVFGTSVLIQILYVISGFAMLVALFRGTAEIGSGDA